MADLFNALSDHLGLITTLVVLVAFMVRVEMRLRTAERQVEENKRRHDICSAKAHEKMGDMTKALVELRVDIRWLMEFMKSKKMHQ